jgi:hypothetical protein
MKPPTIVFLALSLAAGCGGSQKPAEGPAERAGKKVDNAAGHVKDAAKDAKDKVEEKAHQAKDRVDKD